MFIERNNKKILRKTFWQKRYSNNYRGVPVYTEWLHNFGKIASVEIAF
tara:strand:- start:350 stop:493 length:144 start_codon:yes stop_codon:yes gene_type:complete